MNSSALSEIDRAFALFEEKFDCALKMLITP